MTSGRGRNPRPSLNRKSSIPRARVPRFNLGSRPEELHSDFLVGADAMRVENEIEDRIAVGIDVMLREELVHGLRHDLTVQLRSPLRKP